MNYPLLNYLISQMPPKFFDSPEKTNFLIGCFQFIYSLLDEICFPISNSFPFVMLFGLGAYLWIRKAIQQYSETSALKFILQIFRILRHVYFKSQGSKWNGIILRKTWPLECSHINLVLPYVLILKLFHKATQKYSLSCPGFPEPCKYQGLFWGREFHFWLNGIIKTNFPSAHFMQKFLLNSF